MIEKMKSILCVLAGLFVLAQAVQLRPDDDKTYLKKQKAIYELFWHVDQPTVYNAELYQKARKFNIVEHGNSYNDKDAFNEFVECLKEGLLPRGQVFTVTNPTLRHQAELLFRVLYSAQDFETFYETAVWARVNVNELLYIYTLSVAILHRPDTWFLKLPPFHEVVPNYFFNEDVLQKAYDIAMGDVGTGMKKSVGGTEYFVIPANQSAWYMTREDAPEHKLRYFTEDVGLNTFYFLVSHVYPPFMESSKYNLIPAGRGEFYFFMHKQLLTKYYLERLSNDMGEVEYVSLDRPITTGYYPTMHHRNGLRFPHRETGAVIPLHMQKHALMLKELHTRISNAIDLGYVEGTKNNHISIGGERGLDILGNIVQGNADSVNKRYYGNIDRLCKKIFGFGWETNDAYHTVPSALDMYSTSLRDPVFYSIYKHIVSYYMRYKDTIPPYTEKELRFPGVNIESVTVDKLTTYFEYFDSILNNGVSIRSEKDAQNKLIKARQYRLNHKPFTYHITVSSSQPTKSMIRILLGPKTDVHGQELDFEKNYMHFMTIDQWMVDLKTGLNNIERGNHEAAYIVPDEISSDVFYKKILNSLEGSDTIHASENPYGYPERLTLPKGKRLGMQYRLFVVISPVEPNRSKVVDSPVWGRYIRDGRPLGFPLDRPFDSKHLLGSNMYIKDIVIFHKKMEELNVPTANP